MKDGSIGQSRPTQDVAVFVGTRVWPALWDTRVGHVGCRAGAYNGAPEGAGERGGGPGSRWRQETGAVAGEGVTVPAPAALARGTGCWREGPRGAWGWWNMAAVPVWLCLCCGGVCGCPLRHRWVWGSQAVFLGAGPCTVSWRRGRTAEVVSVWVLTCLETSPRGGSPATCVLSISMSHGSSSPPSRCVLCGSVSVCPGGGCGCVWEGLRKERGLSVASGTSLHSLLCVSPRLPAALCPLPVRREQVSALASVPPRSSQPGRQEGRGLSSSGSSAVAVTVSQLSRGGWDGTASSLGGGRGRTGTGVASGVPAGKLPAGFREGLWAWLMG